ncbi:hypothetical protein Slala04_01790 [Streptomyces lavendulae subsp. lavendulae]|nr:hypothetical protein Slala04_01790 [Streptomyces lavendulae subsp. lavendulae]
MWWRWAAPEGKGNGRRWAGRRASAPELYADVHVAAVRCLRGGTEAVQEAEHRYVRRSGVGRQGVGAASAGVRGGVVGHQRPDASLLLGVGDLQAEIHYPRLAAEASGGGHCGHLPGGIEAEPCRTSGQQAFDIADRNAGPPPPPVKTGR